MKTGKKLVKVCGINRKKNLQQVGLINIDMIGINLYMDSPRYIGNLSITINPNIKRVGVFVEPSIWEMQQYIDDCRLDYVQLHGDVSVELCQEIQSETKVIKVFAIDEDFDFAETAPYSFCDYFLFDTKSKDHGGSGRKFGWDRLSDYEGEVPFILAGGISPDDSEALLSIDHQQFVGVDINSRFELEPGLKDLNKVEQFVNEIKGS